jgi:hypothetical protein
MPQDGKNRQLPASAPEVQPLTSCSTGEKLTARRRHTLASACKQASPSRWGRPLQGPKMTLGGVNREPPRLGLRPHRPGGDPARDRASPLPGRSLTLQGPTSSAKGPPPTHHRHASEPERRIFRRVLRSAAPGALLQSIPSIGSISSKWSSPRSAGFLT